MWVLRRIGIVRLEKQNGLPISNHKENGVWMWHEGCLPQGEVLGEEVWEELGRTACVTKLLPVCLLRLWGDSQCLSLEHTMVTPASAQAGETQNL